MNLETLEGVIRLLLLLLLLGASVAALLALCTAILPGLVARTRHTAGRMPVRSFFVGLINFTFFGLIAVALMSAGEMAGVFGVIIATVLFSFVAIGLAAVALLVGKRLRPGDTSEYRQLLFGALTLQLAAVVPLVGWFVVPLLAGLIGFGAVISVVIRRLAERRAARAVRDVSEEQAGEEVR